MTDRKPDLRRYQPLEPEDESEFILASDLPTAILNATKEELEGVAKILAALQARNAGSANAVSTAPELRALAVFAEAMPELLRQAQKIEAEAHLGKQTLAKVDLRFMTNRITDAALAAAKEARND